jgi:hypothetical protein
VLSALAARLNEKLPQSKRAMGANREISLALMRPFLHSMHRDGSGSIWKVNCVEELEQSSGVDEYRVTFQSEQQERMDFPGTVYCASEFWLMYQHERCMPV